MEKNIEYAKEACRFVMSKGHAFFAPHLLYPTILDDNQPTERQSGIEMGMIMLEKCDELWVFGEQLSSGMQIEIEHAKQLSLPIQYFAFTQEHETKPEYAIWAKGRENGPLAGEAGYLCDELQLLCFATQKEAEQYIDDICSLCMNTSPAAEYESVIYPRQIAIPKYLHLEEIKKLDLVAAFAPQNYEIRTRIYENTGGHCMVGTIEFYLPELGKSVWVNCNNEYLSINSEDCIWIEDEGADAERSERTCLLGLDFDKDMPESASSWLPMIMETLAYFIENEANYFGETYLPVSWLPDIFRKGVEPSYLAWLQTNSERVCIAKGNKIIIDEAYQHDGVQSPETGAMAPV